MNAAEQNALLTIALLAAFADGGKDDAERAEVRRVAESLGGAQVNMAALYQDVLLKRVTVASAAAALSSPELRQLAFELAVGVCEADGLRNEAEMRFLAELGQALGLSQPQIAEPTATAMRSPPTRPPNSGWCGGSGRCSRRTSWRPCSI